MNKDNFEKEIPSILEGLKADSQPIWGRMTAQHMVEHLIITWKISRGRINTPIIEGADLEKNKKFLMSDLPYERNIQVPALKGELPKLRFPNLEAAKESLMNEIKEFHNYYRDNPNAIHTNIFFGDLNKNEWLQLHFKHSRHHFSQFDLL